MSGYSPPPTTQMPAARRRSANLDLPQLIGYAAGVLGILSFIWGFLTWLTEGGQGISGYSVAVFGAGTAVIGLSVVAGAIAAADTFEKKQVGAVPAALALVAFFLTLGQLVGKSVPGSHLSAGIGLILTLITTILQAAGLVLLWLLAIERVHLPQRRQAAGGWPPQQPPPQQHPQQHQDPYHPGPGTAGPGAPPPGQFPPQPPPGGYAPPAQHQYGPPPSYGQYSGRPPESPTPGGYGPSAPTSQPSERPGAQWSPQTSYPSSREEPEPPDVEDGSANS